MAIEALDSGLIGSASREEDHTDFPCSVAQERFWLLDRLEPGNPSYSVAVRWKLQGPVSSDLVQKAWCTIIERHEVLRTVFPEVDGKPVQRVLPRIPFKLTEINLARLPAGEREQESDRIGLIEARAPFDLASGPLIRATLIRLSAEEAVLLVTTHQVVSDGWSIGIMAKEMGLIYQALSTGKAEELPELPLQYGDYSLWQLDWLKARGNSAEVEYWTRQLSGVKPFQVIPDHPRLAAPTTNGAIASRVLPRELTNSAQAVSGARGATLFAFALAALCATLSRFADESEIVLGTQVSDRDQVELEPMIGQFVNSLILRVKLEDDPRFVDLIERLRDTVSDALEHRHIPIERLLAMVKAERTDVNSAPISINFIFQKTFIQNAQYGEMSLIDMPSLPAGAIYDLNFFMVERPDGWRFSCQYNTDQFDGATAERLLLYCQAAMESGLANPELRVSQLRLSDPQEVSRLLATMGRAHADHPRRTVDQLFDALVASSPTTPALQHGKIRLSRRQLDDAANRLAQALRPHVTGPGIRIALCLDSFPDHVTAMLAVLKAGAAFFTLDAQSPGQIQSRLDTARPAAVITDAAHAALFGTTGVEVVRIDSPGAGSDAPSLPAIAVPRSLDCDAYVTFTGSRADTASAAVSIGHGVLVDLLHCLQPRSGADDVAIGATLPNDDCTILGTLAALIAGTPLILADPEQAPDDPGFARFLKVSGPALRVLDRSSHPAPIGAVGELHIYSDIGSTEANHRTGLRARLCGDGRIELIAPPEAAAAKVRSREAHAPVGELEQRLAAIWSDMLGIPGIDATSNFFELGGHSLLAARMLARVEQEFGRRITLAALFRSPNVRGLAQAIQTNERSFDFRQVVKLQANGSRPPLIAVNNTGVYYLLAKRLGEDQPVTSLQLFDPSIKGQAAPATVEELATRYVELIRRVQSVGPYQLMGWCAAGPLTFEIARQLTAAGETVSGLYLMDSWIPGYLRRQPPLRRLINDYSLKWQFFRADCRGLRTGSLSFREFFARRGSMQWLSKTLDRADSGDASSGRRPLPDPELYDQWLLHYIQDITSRYQPQTYSGKLVLFRSREEPTGWLFDPHAGWGAVAAGGVELRMIDGDHFTMFQDPGASQIAAAMRAV